ncbi:MAG TPA: LCP family protein [Candidatus Saccharimonadales bacterium]|nr:LCP family protein [Candidatus Saccharimonadales bacterium]
MRSLDGFNRQDRIPRRPRKDGGTGAHPGFQLPQPVAKGSPASNAGISQNKAIDLGTISPDLDIEEPSRSKKRRRGLFGRRRKEGKKRWSRRKKIIVSIISVFLLVGAAIGGYMGWKVLHSTAQVFKGNPFTAVFSNTPLKTDQYGRSNILLFGTSEDDPGHPGGDLTDSIMVISVDQKQHNAFIMSVPRDLWVKFDKTCASGYAGKINEVYLCGKTGGDETSGQEALRSKVGEVFGMDLQYAVHVNYEVLRNSVDALGGVDITINSGDPRGILDRNFDWRCNYKCYLVKWPNGPVHLDGEHALYLSQARNDAGGYGLPRGNFDREANQRKIMLAAKDKAASVGFLANPIKVTKLIDSLGQNVRTNFQAAEIKTLIDIAKNTDSKSIQSISLVDQVPALFTTGAAPTGASIVRPATSGLYDYSGLSAFTKAYLSGNGALIQENAQVDVLNGTSTPGLAQTKADALAQEGIKIGAVSNVPDGTYNSVKLYDLSKGAKPATKKKLEQVLGITTTTEPLPSTVKSTASFVVIVGQ